jgi:hypothetical protein
MTKGIGSMSRRMFLRSGAALALLAAAPTAWARSGGLAPRNLLTRSRFTPLLGASFRMTGDGQDLDVVLAQISNLTPVMRADDPNRFALLLEAPMDHAPSEGIRTFQNDDFGEVDLFVSPVDRGVEARRYEAVINRSLS